MIETFTATDPEDITTADPDKAMTWTVTGPDGELFSIKAVAITSLVRVTPRLADLTFKKAPDYEKPGDANKDNVYEVTVVVTDSDGMKAMRYVTVKVMNLDEDGTVTLSSQQPRVGVPFTAELTDKDGDVTGLKWKWYRSTLGELRTVHRPPAMIPPHSPLLTDDPDLAIKDKDGKLIRSGMYTPNLDDDAYQCLRAIASYSDGKEGDGDTADADELDEAMATSANPVVKDEDNRAPAFSSDTATRMVDENTAKDMNIGAAVEAKDKTADLDDTLTYTLSGSR